jgi:hypothetical protein
MQGGTLDAGNTGRAVRARKICVLMWPRWPGRSPWLSGPSDLLTDQHDGDGCDQDSADANRGPACASIRAKIPSS